MSKSLMIVDDSATMRKIIMKTIRMSGLEFDRTEEAGNGAEALEKMKGSAVDIVLCDINMPEMNGV
jgi:two-component system chemotaxis response regulator CheY